MYKTETIEGKLAITGRWSNRLAEPVEDRQVWISDIPADYVPGFVGRTAYYIEGSGGIFEVFDGMTGERRFLDVHEWAYQLEERPIPKPRRGKSRGTAYDWEYRSGRWVRIEV